MKPFYQKLPTRETFSYDFFEYCEEVHSYPYHFHPEFEFNYFEKYNGKLLINSDVHEPTEGTLLMIGPNIPHANLPHPMGHGQTDHGFTVIFKRNLFGQDFYALPEMTDLNRFLERSKGVYEYSSPKLKELFMDLKAGFEERNPESIIAILRLLLHCLKFEKERKTITEYFEAEIMDEKDQVRIDRIYHYIFNNFHRPVSLEEIAEVVCMSRESLSRYFKKVSGKNLFSFLIEVRVNHAKKLLTETQDQISSICFDCGFGNLANFNRQFKAITGLTPGDFRRKIRI